MLNQAQGDRQILAKQLGISPHQLSYVTHSGPGEGLLFFGNVTIPFVDRFPKNTKLYSIMTTRPNEKFWIMERNAKNGWVSAVLAQMSFDKNFCFVVIAIAARIPQITQCIRNAPKLFVEIVCNHRHTLLSRWCVYCRWKETSMQLLSQVFSIKMLYRQLITVTLSIYKNFSLGVVVIRR